MVLYMRAKIQQKGRNGKRYGLFQGHINRWVEKLIRRLVPG
jgi:hypothetical protein